MKVFNLRCGRDHHFEGWFASEEAFTEQRAGGLVECPLCADRDVVRLPSAPRLNLSGAREQQQPGPVVQPRDSDSLEAMWLKAVQHVLQNTEDVGTQFTEEARRIHYGEVERRGIRGEATPQQREALADEGIEVMQLPMPKVLEGGGKPH
ncbi:DUF1178 family protein [Aquincola sp. S2]|uniref:DUF1178 family protein n=1 Tax=Pseudaquabacterium terrae TaxID=2732868 RepID=A0ABX2EPE1_9BURK|nr:DUF1178 family protein [Aquabacterium terrae]NRF70512.1 DUF1178 family protein [Aquabacterium terrae]